MFESSFIFSIDNSPKDTGYSYRSMPFRTIGQRSPHPPLRYEPTWQDVEGGIKPSGTCLVTFNKSNGFISQATSGLKNTPQSKDMTTLVRGYLILHILPYINRTLNPARLRRSLLYTKL